MQHADAGPGPVLGIGTAAAAAGAVCAAAGVATVGPLDSGRGWTVAVLVAALVVLAVCLAQVILWRQALRVWRAQPAEGSSGPRAELPALRRRSWVAHLVSYAAALAGLLLGLTAIAALGPASTAAPLEALAVLGLLVGQVLAGVQFVRPDGPPGTLPAHARRLRAAVDRARRVEDR